VSFIGKVRFVRLILIKRGLHRVGILLTGCHNESDVQGKERTMGSTFRGRRFRGRWNTVGTFAGFDGGLLLRLDGNGWWLQEDAVRWKHVAFRPMIEVHEGASGTFMRVVGQEVGATFRPIEPVVVSRVEHIFRGWSGTSSYRLANGEIWQQIDAFKKPRYVLEPEALVFRDGRALMMEVANTRVQVKHGHPHALAGLPLLSPDAPVPNGLRRAAWEQSSGAVRPLQ
jgi:hypothetical protein